MQTHQELAKGVGSGSFPSPVSYNLIFLTAAVNFGYISFNRDDIEKKDDTILLEKIRNGSDQLKKRCTAEVRNNDRREHIKMLILPLSFSVSFYIYTDEMLKRISVNRIH